MQEDKLQQKSELGPLEEAVTMQERYRAAMVLAGVGDAMGYQRGNWEFQYDGAIIHKDMLAITKGMGVSHLRIEAKNFPYSDDTVMHIATAKGLIQSDPLDPLETICQRIAKEYKDCWKFMPGRAPGNTCGRYVNQLNREGSNWAATTYSQNAGGCGAAMRAACIGLYYYNNDKRLVEVAIQSGRTTHHNPIGYLGSVVAAYFTALAIRSIPPRLWYNNLFEVARPLIQIYLRQSGRDVEQNLTGKGWIRFWKSWESYGQDRQLKSGEASPAVFPQVYGVEEREKFYKRVALKGWPGALGVDSVIISYDALLGAKEDWNELCLRAMLHGGDNDSTGTIAGAWFGALYGFRGVPTLHHKQLENRKHIQELGDLLYDKVQGHHI